MMTLVTEFRLYLQYRTWALRALVGTYVQKKCMYCEARRMSRGFGNSANLPHAEQIPSYFEELWRQKGILTYRLRRLRA